MTQSNDQQCPPVSPSPNGSDGRDSRGRFSAGNPGGPGNPLGSKIARLRSALVSAVTEEDIEAIAKTLITQAIAGDMAAVRELFNRLLGRPLEADMIDRLEAIERRLEEAAA